MARGLAGSYGVRTEGHPGRQQPRPPQSEQPGRGALIDPMDAEYQRIGDTNTFRTPDRMMTVGVASGAERYPPQSEMPGRGTLVPSWEEQFLAAHPYPQQTDSYGPVAEILNDQQWTPT